MEVDEARALADEKDRTREALKAARTVIEALQFSALGGRRCHICGGWNVGPNGETDLVHTKDCAVPAALAQIRAVLEENK